MELLLFARFILLAAIVTLVAGFVWAAIADRD
jgi:hypothetical protein